MVRIAPIKLQYNPKVLWFDPGDLEIHKDDAVVVTTARGLEFGHAAEDIQEVEDAEVKRLKTELKPVKRLATAEDEEAAAAMQAKSEEALPIFKEMAAESNEGMHPVSVEFLLDGDKAVFYFEAEERIDFRELVRKLASRFHVRIDMRQIGVRDEARIVGGIGHCGQELCCKRLGGEFCPVSIRMAKEQDLSLNPQKISGVCGRLMCCLRYEFDAYKDFKDRAPKVNAKIETPEGMAKVIDLNVPREIVTLKLEDDKTVKIPLSDFVTEGKKGVRPSKVDSEAFERHANQDSFGSLAGLDALGRIGSEESVLFSEEESKGKGRKGKGKRTDEAKEDTRRPRRRTKVGAQGQEDAASGEQGKGQGAQRKKKSGSRNNNKKQGQPAGPENGSSAKQQQQKKQGAKKAGPRPGQKSSGLRTGEGKPSEAKQQSQAASSPKSASPQRRSRRRSHKSGGSGEGSAS